MAVMLSTRTLLDAPDGDSKGVIAKAGTKVDILDEKTPWIQVRLLGIANNPVDVGWVSKLAVDPSKDTIVVGPLDKLMFADECASQAIIWDATAHYIMSVAEARTRITDGPAPNGIDIGPFALSPSEWACYSALPEFQLNFLPGDINDWRLQCALFSVMTVSCQQKLAPLLGDQPTATQLYFAQILGTKAASDGIRNPNKNITDLIAAVSPEDFKSEGLEPDRIVTRYSSLLKDVNAQTALENIDGALQKALDSTRLFILRVGGDILDTSSAPAGPISEPDSLASLTHPQFIEFVAKGARDAMKTTHVPASVTVAQAIVETGWGRHTIGDAKNLFGIKGEGPAGSETRPTREVIHGQSVTMPQPFRKYNSFAESILDHANFFVVNKRYAKALSVANDPNSDNVSRANNFAVEIQRAGYATDPNYAATLIGIMKRFDLYRFDSGA